MNRTHPRTTAVHFFDELMVVPNAASDAFVRNSFSMQHLRKTYSCTYLQSWLASDFLEKAGRTSTTPSLTQCFSSP